MKKLSLLFLLTMGLFVMVSCGDDDDDPPEDDCKTTDLTYTGDIKAILDTSCSVASSCHGSGSPIFEMTNYDQASAAVGFGRIVGAIKGEAGFSQMPPAGLMDDCSIDQVTAWIEAGAPE